jgi:hypothetical protein
MTKRLFAAVIGSAIALGGCGSDTPAGVCSPATAVDCRCDDGRLGSATCNGEGTSFEACTCDGSLPPPTTSSTGGGRECANDLSNIGMADFTVTLKFTNTAAGSLALVSQRDVCGHGMFWDLTVQSDEIEFETDDGTNPYVVLAGTMPLDTNEHKVVAKRTNQMLTVSLDGATIASGVSTTAFAALPPISVGQDVCGEPQYVGELDPCVTSP